MRHGCVLILCGGCSTTPGNIGPVFGLIKKLNIKIQNSMGSVGNEVQTGRGQILGGLKYMCNQLNVS